MKVVSVSDTSKTCITEVGVQSRGSTVHLSPSRE